MDNCSTDTIQIVNKPKSLRKAMLTGFVQSNKVSVKINRCNIYPIYYKSMVTVEFHNDQIIQGDIEILQNIKAGSKVRLPNLNEGIVEKIEKEKVFLKDIKGYYDIKLLIPLDHECVVFVPS